MIRMQPLYVVGAAKRKIPKGGEKDEESSSKEEKSNKKEVSKSKN